MYIVHTVRNDDYSADDKTLAREADIPVHFSISEMLLRTCSTASEVLCVVAFSSLHTWLICLETLSIFQILRRLRVRRS